MSPYMLGYVIVPNIYNISHACCEICNFNLSRCHIVQHEKNKNENSSLKISPCYHDKRQVTEILFNFCSLFHAFLFI